MPDLAFLAELAVPLGAVGFFLVELAGFEIIWRRSTRRRPPAEPKPIPIAVPTPVVRPAPEPVAPPAPAPTPAPVLMPEPEPEPEPAPAVAAAPEPPALSPFERFSLGLTRTRQRFAQRLKDIFSLGRKLDAETLEELEETLIEADMGVETVGTLIQDLEAAYRRRDVADADGARTYLIERLKREILEERRDIRRAASGPTVILVAGVNGAGKTTSIAKLACQFRREGLKVLLAASDTFRAAAVEQLTVWAERLGVGIVKHQQGADPAAVTFDAVDAALARGVDVLIVDTAGRLQTHDHLMKELGKIRDVIRRKIPDAPHEVLMVLDATTGQNAISQARTFHQAVGLTGIFLAKLDGTAKGGIVVAIKKQLDIPVKFVGLGEKPEDVAPFDAAEFVEALFRETSAEATV